MTYAAAGLVVHRTASPRVTTIESVRTVGMSFLLSFLPGAGGSVADRPVQAARLDTLGDVVIEVWTTRGIRPALPAERFGLAPRLDGLEGLRRIRVHVGRGDRQIDRRRAPVAQLEIEPAGSGSSRPAARPERRASGERHRGRDAEPPPPEPDPHWGTARALNDAQKSSRTIWRVPPFS